jgi:hypothetical protein
LSTRFFGQAVEIEHMIPVPVGQQDKAECQSVLGDEPEHLLRIGPRIEGNGFLICPVPEQVGMHLHPIPIRGEHRHPLGELNLAGMIIAPFQRQQARCIEIHNLGNPDKGVRIRDSGKQCGNALLRQATSVRQILLGKAEAAFGLAEHIDPGVLKRCVCVAHGPQMAWPRPSGTVQADLAF